MNYTTANSKQPLSTQKPLNEKVQKYLCCSKRLDQAYSVTELANATGVSRRYVQRNASRILDYYSIAPIPTDSDLKWYHDRSLDYYLKDTGNMRASLGAIIGYLLKYRYGQLGHLRKAQAIISAGDNIVKLTAIIKARKHSTGTPISANSKAAKVLLDHNKVTWIDKLFIRTGGYYAGHSSKLWKTTELMDNVLTDALIIYFTKITNNDINLPLFNCRADCRSKCGTYSSICSAVGATLQTQVSYNKPKQAAVMSQQWFIKPLVVTIQQAQQLCLSSQLHIISNSIGFENGNFIVSLNHTSSTDPSLGRSYNVFTRLRSFERKQLGYINYDMSCALQTISLQLIQATEDDYPLLTYYAKDISFKRALRDGIANDLNISVSDVKQKLTAFANGGVSGIDKHPLYKQFQSESDRLRIEVLAYTAEHDPQLLKQAVAQSKKKLPEDIDWFSMNTEDSQALARGKSSVYFFIWTYYERLIRKDMLTVLSDGIEVHDAVYSKMNVSTDDIEAIIFESTGFKIIIDKE